MTAIHKEALADAKRLREVAEENAKQAIIEQITPTIKNMIERELLGESYDGVEEDILISPNKEEKEKKEEEDERVDEVTLTNESVAALAQMKMNSAKSEHYGVRTLRISEKIDRLHEAKVNENTYGEKLRQIKNEVEKTFIELQEDKKKNIVPDNSANLIEGKLEELWEVTNNLMIPVKVRQINESNKEISNKFSKFKIIAEEYSLTNGAKQRFGQECIKLVKETKALFNSIAELKEVTKDSSVEKVHNETSGLFKEIYKMAKKFGSLNEEELKIVISGLNTDDLEGSPLSAMVEPADEDMDDDMDMDDMGMDDDMGDDMGGDEMDDIGMDDMDDEEKIDEYTYSASGGRGRGVRSMSQKVQADPDKKSTIGGSAKTGRDWSEDSGRDWSDEERKAAGLPRKKQQEGDEMLEISEVMLKQELLRLKKRRAAMSEAMKAMKGPGSFDNFGGAGRSGGGVEGDVFEDFNDLNGLDPVGEAGSVNESEEEMDEYTYKASGGSGRGVRSMSKKIQADPKKVYQGDKKEEKSDEPLKKEVRAYKKAILNMQENYEKIQQQLRESNLSNAKLVYATKLMQNENLSKKQRLIVVEQLDQAQSVREVKKLFTALKEALEKGNTKSKLTESAERKVIGGSSRATGSGSTTLTESENKEFARWGQLAGFLKG